MKIRSLDAFQKLAYSLLLYYLSFYSFDLWNQGAASMAGRKISVLREAGAASDHPIDPSYPEGAYLSNILLRVL
jgi:23S rRNA G2069 N7-methylase RlmK/C1962 C5-methylase RlmI